MAKIEDRKGTFYSQKQTVRDELSAPLYLESAGDILVKNLAKKQTKTTTTLKEQLEIVQNFEKGFELNPEIQKGIVPLREFQARIQSNGIPSADKSFKGDEIQNVDELMKITGLSRHELELSLCEKPNSDKSRLYKFAISSKRQNRKSDLKSQLPDHPINKLKEIEEECFGRLKKDKVEGNIGEYQNPKAGEKRVRKRKRGKRKRKRKRNDESMLEKKQPEDFQTVEAPVTRKEDELQEASCSRLSLWDVKSMKKWSESKIIGCAPRKYYTIKDGKIVQV